eukprot:TRINITY_DN30876_c0_g1_i1.p1 TRINITY_DN30876_c0_g1~~TRINITY_DN30876_c0_g1_i1.p1  ORF type:complete len:233 (+),score=114.84 TRINITY_DN30876_c0_g1_i1:73-771(+)
MLSNTRIITNLAFSTPKTFNVRGFASEKMELPGTSGRYAVALHDAATQKGVTAKVEEDVKKFKDVLSASGPLRVYLDSPVIPKPERLQTIGTILQKLNVSDQFKNLFSALVENRRTNITGQVLDDYLKLMKHERREVDAVITTATPLSGDQMNYFKTFIVRHYLNENDKLQVVNKVDDTIVGGYQLQVGDLFLDRSAKNNILRTKKAFVDSIRATIESKKAAFAGYKRPVVE